MSKYSVSLEKVISDNSLDILYTPKAVEIFMSLHRMVIDRV